MGSQWFVCSFFDNQTKMLSSLFCSDGKCSICGEPYDQKVKLFEKGGAKYKGTIVETYTQGAQIDVKVMVN